MQPNVSWRSSAATLPRKRREGNAVLVRRPPVPLPDQGVAVAPVVVVIVAGRMVAAAPAAAGAAPVIAAGGAVGACGGPTRSLRTYPVWLLLLTFTQGVPLSVAFTVASNTVTSVPGGIRVTTSVSVAGPLRMFTLSSAVMVTTCVVAPAGCMDCIAAIVADDAGGFVGGSDIIGTGVGAGGGTVGDTSTTTVAASGGIACTVCAFAADDATADPRVTAAPDTVAVAAAVAPELLNGVLTVHALSAISIAVSTALNFTSRRIICLHSLSLLRMIPSSLRFSRLILVRSGVNTPGGDDTGAVCGKVCHGRTRETTCAVSQVRTTYTRVRRTAVASLVSSRALPFRLRTARA